MADKTKEQLIADFEKGAKALNKIAAKLNLEHGEAPPEFKPFKPFKGTPKQLADIKERMKDKTVNNNGWTSILGYCGITGTGPVLAARQALEAADVIDVEKADGIGRSASIKVCLHGEEMKAKWDVLA